MANEIWQQENQDFLNAISNIGIPNATLDDVQFITPHLETDFEGIPETGGCYWIWTNEPVLHSMHKNKTPNLFEGGEIIYNGIAKDNVRARAKHHLLGTADAGWSGISLDIHFGGTISHRKKAFSKKDKVSYIKENIVLKRANKSGLIKGDTAEKLKPIRSKADLSNLHLSDSEKHALSAVEDNTIYFRNGIDIREEKHSHYEFRVYFITELSPLYIDLIEKKWREDFGLPKLCSYSSGR